MRDGDRRQRIPESHYLTWMVGLDQPTPHLGMKLVWEGKTIGVVTKVTEKSNCYEMTALIDEKAHRAINDGLTHECTFSLAEE